MDGISSSPIKSETLGQESALAADQVPEKQKLPDVTLDWELEAEVHLPEHRLYQALLFRAYSDATSLCACAQHVQREAREWIHGNEDYFLSFLWVCDKMNMSPRGIEIYRSHIPMYRSLEEYVTQKVEVLPKVPAQNGSSGKRLVDSTISGSSRKRLLIDIEQLPEKKNRYPR